MDIKSQHNNYKQFPPLHIFVITGAVAYSFAYYGQGNGPIVLDNVQCTGNEISLFDCSYDPDTSDCTHFEDAGVMCLELERE